MKKLLLSLLLASLTGALCAQEATPEPSLPPLPPGPLYQKRAPDPSQWVITSVPRKAPVSKSGAPTGSQKSGDSRREYAMPVVQVTKTGKVMLRQVSDGQKRVWNTWCVDPLQITVSPDGTDATVQARTADLSVETANFVDYSETDFPGFEWITEKSYAGIKSISGRTCILYQDTVTYNKHDNDHTVTAAYVDLDSRLPVALNISGASRTYQFSTPPQEPLVVPDLVNTLLENMRKMSEAATPHRPANP